MRPSPTKRFRREAFVEFPTTLSPRNGEHESPRRARPSGPPRTAWMVSYAFPAALLKRTGVNSWRFGEFLEVGESEQEYLTASETQRTVDSRALTNAPPPWESTRASGTE